MRGARRAGGRARRRPGGEAAGRVAPAAVSEKTGGDGVRYADLRQRRAMRGAPGGQRGGRHQVPNSGRRRLSWACRRCTMLLCIWLTRLSLRSSVAPISFMVNSS